MNRNVIYKLCVCVCVCVCVACKDYVAYVGQTKRKLNIRIVEHKKDIKKTSNHSVITEHRLEYDHEFDWENPKILDIEKHYNKRLLSEMINIRAQKKSTLICKLTPNACNMLTSTFLTNYTNRRSYIFIYIVHIHIDYIYLFYNLT